MYEDVMKLVEEHYDYGKVKSLKLLTGGLNNESWKGIFEKDGKEQTLFVRIYAARKEEYEVEYESGLMHHLKNKGMKTNAQFLKSRNGKLCEPVFRIPGKRQFLALQEWLEGEDEYFWAESTPTKEALMSAIDAVAQLHGYAYDYEPPEGVNCKEPIFQLQLKHHYADFEKWSKELYQDHFKQHIGQYMVSQLEYMDKVIKMTDKLWEKPDDLPVCNIHTDTHLGNFKFVDEQVTAIFDFDWAKKDVRLYDIAMAVVTFCTSWFYDRHADINIENMKAVLAEYNREIIRTKADIGQMTEREAELLPEMMIGVNLYIHRDLLRQIYENRDLSDFEYLYYMIHQVECYEWIENHYDEIIQIAKDSIVR